MTLILRPILVCAALGLAAILSPCRAAPGRPVPIEARLSSCDPAAVRAAVEDTLKDPGTRREPVVLFLAAQAERMMGNKDQAAFLFLAARLRMSRQALLGRNDTQQVLDIMIMTIGSLIVPDLLADPDMTRRAVKRVTDWDRATPDPFRDQASAKGGQFPVKLAEIDAALARLPSQAESGAGVTADGGMTPAEAERQLAAMRQASCAPGKVTGAERYTASERIKRTAEQVAADHPLVHRRAAGAVQSVSTYQYENGASGLPSRVTVGVPTTAGKYFYAVVDVKTTVSSKGRLEGVAAELACVTDNAAGQRDASWKDICMDDPTAIRPWHVRATMQEP